MEKRISRNASSTFDTKNQKDDTKIENDKLYSKIGQLQVEIDFLKQVLGKWVQLKKGKKLLNLIQDWVLVNNVIFWKFTEQVFIISQEEKAS